MDKKRVYDVLRTRCHDPDAERPWKHQRRLARKALTDATKVKRKSWSQEEQASERTEGRYFRYVTWTDLCYQILPRTEAKASEQALARKGNKGWLSEDAKGTS